MTFDMQLQALQANSHISLFLSADHFFRHTGEKMVERSVIVTKERISLSC
jgi:hypothetical protein